MAAYILGEDTFKNGLSVKKNTFLLPEKNYSKK